MLPYWMNLVMEAKKKNGEDKKPNQGAERKRIHSRAYHGARTAIRDGKSEVDLYLTSL